MSAPAPSDAPFDPREPIPGYVTRELIGRGGFGEVWKAVAPGGLMKAIKIVHAGVDSSRAERELRALQRIRDVRHPLILSIERIEIIAGTLVIVTELADGSLRDLFNKCRSQGQPGIPRERLQLLLRDAADALDYIYEEHSLQHLDIKPENLLLVGNRLKVGDFGLIKNIYERGASLVNGLTPTYAPPELFEGKPTRQSDQYSLAIVYQHMLTGELPFDGATPAQLAREHLAGVPRLTLLSKSERTIVARALAKSPADRYESCRTLLEQLSTASQEPVEAVDDGDQRLLGAASHTHTVPLAGPGALAPPNGATASIPAPGAAPAGRGPAIDPLLGALEVSLQPTRNSGDTTSRRSEAILGTGFVPTVFIGVGGTGGIVLRELRARIQDSLGPLSEMPSVQMLLLDTDGRALNVLMRDNDIGQSMDVAALPLRRPEEYKFRESRLSKWLHRRWIYNMPRSLATEGYRPLGRLAFVDHCQRVLTSLRTAIAKAASAENAAKSAAATGLPFRHGHVRVVFVASISGATGSGMLLDLAYAARHELKKRSLPNEDLVACLLHSTPGNPAERDKAIANAYALLSELGHYSSPGHFYPGEAALETQQFHGDNRTFGTTYMVNLGHDVGAQRWQAAAAEVAEYLYLTTATPAKMVVDAARHADEGLASTSRTKVLVRSLNVHQLDRAYSHDVAVCIAQACRDLVSLWESGRRPAKPGSSPSIAVDRAAIVDIAASPARSADEVAAERATAWLLECELEANALQRLAQWLHEQVWQCNESNYLHQLFQLFCDETREHNMSRAEIVDSAIRHMDRLLGESPPVDDARTLRDELRDRLAACAGEIATELLARIKGLVDQTDAGIGAARLSALALSSRITELRSELERQRRAALATVAERLHTLQAGPPVPPPSGFTLFRRKRSPGQGVPTPDELADYAAGRLVASRLEALQSFLDAIGAQISGLSDQLNQLSRELTCLSAEFPSPEPAHDAPTFAGPETQAFVQRIRQALLQHRESIVLAVNAELNRTTLTGDRKLQRYVGVRSELQGVLRLPIIAAARRAVADQVRQTTLQWIAESAGDSAAGREAACGRLVAEFLAERRTASHAVLDPVLVLAPDSVEPRDLSQAFASCKDARLVPARTNGITVFAEVAPRPLEDVADEIVQGQELYRQLAQKLHTREDVDWSPLPTPRSPKRDTGSGSVHVHIHAAPPK